jgi:hypothetical protein
MIALITKRIGWRDNRAVDSTFLVDVPARGMRRWLRRMQETTIYPITVRARAGRIVAESNPRFGLRDARPIASFRSNDLIGKGDYYDYAGQRGGRMRAQSHRLVPALRDRAGAPWPDLD